MSLLFIIPNKTAFVFREIISFEVTILLQYSKDDFMAFITGSDGAVAKSAASGLVSTVFASE